MKSVKISYFYNFAFCFYLSNDIIILIWIIKTKSTYDYKNKLVLNVSRLFNETMTFVTSVLVIKVKKNQS